MKQEIFRTVFKKHLKKVLQKNSNSALTSPCCMEYSLNMTRQPRFIVAQNSGLLFKRPSL